MAWTHIPHDPYIASGDVEQTLINHLTAKGDCDVIGCEIVPNITGIIAYLAIQWPDSAISAAVCQIEQSCEEELCYRLLHETEAPPHYGCPPHLLSLLTPPHNNEAKLWRRMCASWATVPTTPRMPR